MSEKNNGGAAFPLYGVSSVVQHGMDLRDYFAAKAMAAVMVASEGKYKAVENAKLAYAYADAMLAERAK